jgi:hypothetical protein
VYITFSSGGDVVRSYLASMIGRPWPVSWEFPDNGAFGRRKQQHGRTQQSMARSKKQNAAQPGCISARLFQFTFRTPSQSGDTLESYAHGFSMHET